MADNTDFTGPFKAIFQDRDKWAAEYNDPAKKAHVVARLDGLIKAMKQYGDQPVRIKALVIARAAELAAPQAAAAEPASPPVAEALPVTDAPPAADPAVSEPAPKMTFSPLSAAQFVDETAKAYKLLARGLRAPAETLDHKLAQERLEGLEIIGKDEVLHRGLRERAQKVASIITKGAKRKLSQQEQLQKNYVDKLIRRISEHEAQAVEGLSGSEADTVRANAREDILDQITLEIRQSGSLDAMGFVEKHIPEINNERLRKVYAENKRLFAGPDEYHEFRSDEIISKKPIDPMPLLDQQPGERPVVTISGDNREDGKEKKIERPNWRDWAYAQKNEKGKRPAAASIEDPENGDGKEQVRRYLSDSRNPEGWPGSGRGK